MNWLDVAIAAMIIIGALIGWRTGLVRAALSIAGVFIGFVIGAHLSGPIAGLLTDSVGSASIAAVVAYLIVGVIVFIAVQIFGMVATKALKVFFLGWANSLGGAFAGAVAGFVIGAVLVTALARLAFLVPASTLERGRSVEARQGLLETLVGSSQATTYLDIYDRLPVHALGLTPGAFHDALQELRRAKDR